MIERKWVEVLKDEYYKDSKYAKDYDFHYYIGKRRVAIVYWLGGFVERLDEWITVTSCTEYSNQFMDLSTAQKYVEDIFEGINI